MDLGLLGSGSRLAGRIGLGVRASVSIQIFALRMFYHSARGGVTSGRFSQTLGKYLLKSDA